MTEKMKDKIKQHTLFLFPKQTYKGLGTNHKKYPKDKRTHKCKTKKELVLKKTY
jgi:hypothetical protein